MGQGTHTKIAQLVANTFGLPFEKVQISSTNTSKVPNTSASAAVIYNRFKWSSNIKCNRKKLKQI